MHQLHCACTRCRSTPQPLFPPRRFAAEAEFEEEFEQAFSFVGFPATVLAALRAGDERAALQRAAAAGFGDENTLTDLVFHHRHRERQGAPLRSSEPGYASLAAEWMAIRDQLVRGVPRAPLATAPPAPAPAGAPDIVSVRGIQVARAIAAPLERLLAAAQADGVTLGGSGWRSPDQQIALRRKNCGSSHADIYDKSPSLCSPPTAKPGTSNHERGLAIDFSDPARPELKFGDSPGFVWMKQNAARFGFYNLASEPWHWSVDGR